MLTLLNFSTLVKDLRYIKNASVLIVTASLVALAVIAFFTWWFIRKRKLKKDNGDTSAKSKHNTPREWLIAHKPTKRRIIQLYAALLYNANIKGYISGEIYTSATTKYLCVPGLNCYSCPAAVGACPLGAFQNALAESKTRFPYYILGIIALFGLTLARTICGFLCPVGLAQELLYKIRSPKLKKSRVTRVLSYFKYVVLALLVIIIPLLYAFRDFPLPAFCKYICPAGTIGGAVGLLLNPNNADMFNMLGGQFAWKFGLLVVFVVASVFIFRFFCRFFCPLGAIYGFFNRISLIGVKVDQKACTHCGKCISVCKMDTKCVGDHECINCGQCISACPHNAISWKTFGVCFCKSAADEALPNQALEDSVTDEITPKPYIDKLETKPFVAQTAGAGASVNATVTAVTNGEQTAVRKKKDKRFWLELTAWIVAFIVLVGAFVYYNAIDVPKPVVDIGYKVGQTAPDFTVKLYESDDSFTLYDHRGKLTVVNFWATWCTPCVKEMPYFDQLAKDYPDINVIAIHGSSTRDVTQFIKENWPNHVVTFAQDNISGANCLTYKLLGGKSSWPMTLIIDANGVVLYNSTVSFHSYNDLEKLVKNCLPQNSDSE